MVTALAEVPAQPDDVFKLDIVVIPDASTDYTIRGCTTNDTCAGTCASSCVSSS